MDARELRIGNLIYSFNPNKKDYPNDLLITVNHRHITNCFNDPDSYSAIPITEEWLLKFGFELEYKSEFTIKYTMNDASIGYDWSKLDGWAFRYFGNKIKCKYVHKLQNIYFALTGTELVLSGSAKV